MVTGRWELRQDLLLFYGINHNGILENGFHVPKESTIIIDIDSKNIRANNAVRSQIIDVPKDYFEYTDDVAKYNSLGGIAHYDVSSQKLHFVEEKGFYRHQYSVEPNQHIVNDLLRKHRMGYDANDTAIAMLAVYTDLDINGVNQSVRDEITDIELNIKEDIRTEEIPLYM